MNTPLPIQEALKDPRCYPHRPDRVDFVETHISWVFLAGDLVYKVKKPLDFGFLDFTTLEKRRHFCEEEVRLNRRLAPEYYLGTVPIVRKGEDFVVEGSGPAEEFAVKMLRMPQERMMDRILDRGEAIDESAIIRIASLLAEFYENAETGGRVDRYGEIDVIRYNTDEDFKQMKDYIGVALSQKRFDTIREYTNSFYENRELFQSRILNGRIRECHGDLHSGNICLADEVVIFDCIEFNPRFRCSDTAADVAFLAMDLDFRNRADLSNLFVRTFSERSGDSQCLELMNFYKCYRACVRGKVLSFEFDQPEASVDWRRQGLETGKRYFALAERYTGCGRRPKLLVVFGLMGTGKTTLAEAMAKVCDAPVIQSDLVRKYLSGVAPTERRLESFGKGIYSSETTGETYRRMLMDAEKFLAQGQDVILDASFSKREHRGWVLETARRLDAEPCFIQCVCGEGTVRERLARRAEAPLTVSDGRWELFHSQKARFEPPDEIDPKRLFRVDSEEPVDRLLNTLRTIFENEGQ